MLIPYLGILCFSSIIPKHLSLIPLFRFAKFPTCYEPERSKLSGFVVVTSQNVLERQIS